MPFDSAARRPPHDSHERRRPWRRLGTMRVLVTSVSALGHVHPMVPLVRALLHRGHLVRRG